VPQHSEDYKTAHNSNVDISFIKLNTTFTEDSFIVLQKEVTAFIKIQK